MIAETRHLVLSLWGNNSIRSELKQDKTPVSEVDLRVLDEQKQTK